MNPEVPRVSIVVPAYNEGDQIVPVLDRLFESVHLQCEVLVVVDDENDTTVPVVTEYALKEPRIRYLVNTYGPGPANAIRFGIDVAAAPVAVVTMADGCDDPRQIDDLARLVDRGVAVAAASRYMAGGQQVGGPVLDRQAGISNFRVARWVPEYLRWYRFAFGPRLTAEQIRARGETATNKR